MFSLVHDIYKCRNNNVSLNEAKNALSTHIWKTARRVVDIVYKQKNHSFIKPQSEIGDFMYGKPIHSLNTRLLIRSNSDYDISRIKIRNIPENDSFWLQEGEIKIQEDNFFMNDLYAFRLLKGGTQLPNNIEVQESSQFA